MPTELERMLWERQRRKALRERLALEDKQGLYSPNESPNAFLANAQGNGSGGWGAQSAHAGGKKKKKKNTASGGYATAPVAAYAAAVLSDTPVAYYRHEAGALGTDSSGNGYHAVTTTAVTEVTGGVDGGGSYDGSTSYQKVLNSGFLQNLAILNAYFMVEAVLILPASGPFSSPMIATKGPNAATSCGWQCNYDSWDANQLNLLAFSSGNEDGFKTTAGLPTGVPIHVAIGMQSGTPASRVAYVNGVPVAVTNVSSPSGSPATDAAEDLYLGVRNGSGSAFNNWFQGTMDEVAIYDKLLTPAQVLAHAQSGGFISSSAYYSLAIAQSPLAYWRLNEASGAALDLIGGKSAAVTGAMIYQQTTLITGDGDSCARSNASRFSAPSTSDLEISGARSIVFTTKNATGAFYSTRAAFLGKKLQTGNFQGWAVRVSQTASDRKPHFIIRVDGTHELSVKGSTALQDGTAYHIVVTYDGSYSSTGVKIYVNGVEETYTVLTDTLASHPTSTAQFEMFAEGGNGLPFAGYLDEVMLTDTVISATNVAALATAAGY
jgi:hypothetical protein